MCPTRLVLSSSRPPGRSTRWHSARIVAALSKLLMPRLETDQVDRPARPGRAGRVRDAQLDVGQSEVARPCGAVPRIASGQGSTAITRAAALRWASSTVRKPVPAPMSTIVWPRRNGTCSRINCPNGADQRGSSS